MFMDACRRLFSLLLALALAPTVAPAAAAAEPPEIVILGSSSVNGALGRLIESELEARGYQVTRRGKSSTGFSRPDFYDWPKEAKGISELRGAKSAIVYMGVNDGQSIWLHKSERPSRGGKDEWVYFRDQDEWQEKYLERVQSFVQQLCDGGLQRVVVVTPMDVVNTKLQSRLVKIRELQRKAAEATTCGKAVGTHGDDEAIRSSKAKRNELRIPDGSHATRKGADVIWKRMQGPLFAALPPPSKPTVVGP